MKFWHQVLRFLPAVMLVCSPLPAQAQFSQQAKLVGTGVIGSLAAQGWSVSLSGDGNTAIVGGYEDDATPETNLNQVGAAWVFTRTGGVWSQQAKLVATDAVNSPYPANQGYSVSISVDGNTAIVGGWDDNNA